MLLNGIEMITIMKKMFINNLLKIAVLRGIFGNIIQGAYKIIKNDILLINSRFKFASVTISSYKVRSYNQTCITVSKNWLREVENEIYAPMQGQTISGCEERGGGCSWG